VLRHYEWQLSKWQSNPCDRVLGWYLVFHSTKIYLENYKQEEHNMSVVGGIILIWLIALLCGRFFFKSIPTGQKIINSSLISYFICLVYSGYVRMDGGIETFEPMYVEYFLSTILVILIRLGALEIRGK
jgi:hypothetical protein